MYTVHEDIDFSDFVIFGMFAALALAYAILAALIVWCAVTLWSVTQRR